jgi:hypothetical protein
MGFPTRILRQHLGSKLKDRRRVENPKTEAGADRYNLLEHTAVGCGLITPRVSLIAEWDATLSKFNIFHQEEAWNTDHEQANPVLSRLGTGMYYYTFASSYLDNDGSVVPLNLVAARATVVRRTSNFIADPTVRAQLDGNRIEISTYNVGSYSDIAFWLEVM